MNTISVKSSESYDVIVGCNILDQIGTYVSALCNPCKVAIVSDSNVFPIYGSTIISALRAFGFSAVQYVFTAGEERKNIETYFEILNFLSENRISRSDLIIALGGGVVGDITGFAAATYLRGISYIQVPTSLLAMVDSSVGGKTAIDLPNGKNLVGAFKQPKLVVCDVSVLNTLPNHILIDGCAEVIKYGVLYDAALFNYLQETGIHFDRETVVSRCISHKAAVVREDEFDTGARQKLNLGHTIGHGIEARSNFTISHGQAVAAGMAIVTKAAVSTGLCTASALTDLLKLLQQFSLPTGTAFNEQELFQSALSDKKRSGDSVNLIIPRSIGHCEIIATPISELESFIKAGL